jgi:predicted Zn-dependent protease
LCAARRRATACNDADAPSSPARRLFGTALLAGTVGLTLPACAEQQKSDGVSVGGQSQFTKLVPAADVEKAATTQYSQLLQQAKAKGLLAPDNDPQVVRLRAIAQRLIPYTSNWNARASSWKWEVNLIKSKDVNAFCMPGGKIAFFTGLLEQLKLNDDEVAMVMGHEIAHALREHAREQMGKSAATQIGAGVLSSLLGLGGTGDYLLNMGGQLLTLKFGRDDESEADLVGLDLGARAGYDPRGAVNLWKKMLAMEKSGSPEFLSTHPAGGTRINDIEANLPRVMPLYERAQKPPRRYDAA